LNGSSGREPVFDPTDRLGLEAVIDNAKGVVLSGFQDSALLL
jgi:hypothetical protein